MISFCKIKIKDCDNICFKVSHSQNDLNPIRQKSAFFAVKAPIGGLGSVECFAAPAGVAPFQGPSSSLRWFLENMTENPNWNSNSNGAVGSINSQYVGDLEMVRPHL